MGIPEVAEDSTSGLNGKDAKSTGAAANGVTCDDDDDDDGTGVADSPATVQQQMQIYRCATCGLSLTSLKKFMDHRNFDCIAGVEDTMIVGGGTTRGEPEEGPVAMETENSLESEATTSGRDDGPPSTTDFDVDNPSTTRSPSTCSLTPTEIDQMDVDRMGSGSGSGLPEPVTAIEATPYACQFCDKAFPRLSYLKRHEQGHGDLMPFKCDFCHRLFKHKRSRDRHVKLHTGDKKYRCSHCDSAFSRSDHLKIHLKTHDTAKPFQCTVCNRGYNTAAALTSHMQNHKKASIEKPRFRCLQCMASFQTANQLKDHLVTHGSECSSPATAEHRPTAGHQCPICFLDFNTLDNLYQHMKTHTDVAVVTGDMDQSTEEESTSGCNLNCVYCTKDGFPTPEALQSHVQTMHAANGERSPKTSNRTTLPAAVAPPTPSPLPKVHQLSCEYCTMKFSSTQTLQKHTLSVHSFSDLVATSPTTGPQPHRPRQTMSPEASACSSTSATVVCQHCTMGFKSDAVLAEHVRLVHGVEFARESSAERGDAGRSRLVGPSSSPTGSSGDRTGTRVNGDFAHPGTLLCNQCDAAFPDFEAFRTHLKTHLDEVVEKHVCGECSGEFGSADELEGHAAGHYLSTTTEYGCQSCLKLFSKPDELQKHLMDIHAHHLYRCSLCHKVFDSKVSVQVHFAVKHSNECRLYRCTGCSSSFRSEREFNVHVRVAHVRRSQPFRCLFCHFSYDSELELQCHLTTHKKQFKCRLCDDAFHVEFLLDRHVQSKHAPSSASPVAIVVDAKSTSVAECNNKSKVALPAAAAVASSSSSPPAATSTTTTTPSPPRKKEPQPPFRCDACDAEFPTELSLSAHRRQVHHHRGSVGPSTSKSLSSAGHQGHHHGHQQQQQQQHHHHHVLSLHCAYCNESCKSRTELEQHVTRLHRNANCSGKHKCNICDELCPTATMLAEHKLTTHCKVTTGSTCVLCKANLKTEDQFYSHLQLHGGGSGSGSTNSEAHSPAAGESGSGAGSSSVLPVPCVVCRQTLMTEIEVQMHGKFHLRNVAEPLHPCCLCLKLFELINLIENSVGGGQSFICKECFHRRGPSPPPGSSSGDRLRCPDCCVKFETSAELESHSRIGGCGGCSTMTSSCVRRKTYQCIKCQASFDSEAEIQVHVATHVLHEGTCHECRLCTRTFDSPAKLQCHLVEHTFEGARGGGYACYMCSAVFTTAALLQTHMLEHGLDSRPYDCSRCHQRFFFRAELENHAFSHVCHAADDDDNSKCPRCPELEFVSSSDMQRHYFDVHGRTIDSAELQPSKGGCSFECGEDLDSLGHRHDNQYRQQQDHSHPIGRRFLGGPVMTDASMTVKPYECPGCRRRFARKDNLRAHVLKSRCGGAGTNSRKPTSLSSRQARAISAVAASSSSSSRRVCGVCSTATVSTRALRRHMRDTHGRKYEFVCPLCADPFSAADSLERHLVRSHSVVDRKSCFETGHDRCPSSDDETASASAAITAASTNIDESPMEREEGEEDGSRSTNLDEPPSQTVSLPPDTEPLVVVVVKREVVTSD